MKFEGPRLYPANRCLELFSIFWGHSSMLSLAIQWKPRDLWVGAYWRRRRRVVHVWICLLPCIPISILRVYDPPR